MTQAELSVATLSFVLAALAAGTMGFAIQRGATCTVAAVEEVMKLGSTKRLAAMAEASVWVAGGLLLAQHLHWLALPLTGFALNGWTLCGAALLGLGAFVNRACVFGAIARIGSGDWAYLATPVGFYVGCLSVPLVFASSTTEALAQGSVVLEATNTVVWPLILFIVWRIATLLASGRRRDTGVAQVGEKLWAPHVATLVIGVTFVVTLLLAGVWAYTDALADLARGMAHSLVARLLLALALLVGALVGGRTAGRLRWSKISFAALLRCAIGGLLMAWGSALIPGSNDGLILVGMPLLWPYAWASFATMCLTIAGAWWLHRRLGTGG